MAMFTDELVIVTPTALNAIRDALIEANGSAPPRSHKYEKLGYDTISFTDCTLAVDRRDDGD